MSGYPSNGQEQGGGVLLRGKSEIRGKDNKTLGRGRAKFLESRKGKLIVKRKARSSRLRKVEKQVEFANPRCDG
jgi:hypothetical protein